MAAEPKTLQDAILYFADADNCLNYLVARRWPDGVVVCPTCGRTDVSFVPARRVWQCKTRHAKSQFSIKVGTIFEDSPISLDKWLLAMWMLASCKNGVSSYEISRATGISQKSTWFMLQRIRLSMQDETTGGKLSGECEVDETFIGGKARNMHKDVKARRIRGTGPEGKAVVAAVLERGGKVRAKVMRTVRKPELQAMVREHVEPKSALYTDALKSYEGLSEDYTHQVIDHAVEYVRENVHTNGLENFWSLLKRGINGTYISIEPFHLFRYVDEQAFRFDNRRDMNDSDRFDLAVRQIVGKRLTWAEVTGNVEEKQTVN
ncbi:MAG TPA: IS1595 family transposase [Bryobacteraceae bacterium]|nr:IS1595 family transposase [Bryobacteraceae bacterium]